MVSHRLAPLVLLLVAGLLAAPARAAEAPQGEGGKPYLDVRDGAKAEGIADARNGADVPAGQERAARALVRGQGAGAALTLDPTTATVRSLADLSGALTGPAGGSRREIALDYVRAHRVALGLTAADLDTLVAVPSPAGPDGVTVVRWRQERAGVPLFDNGLTVAIDRAGRVLSVGGSPVHLPEGNDTTPEIGAGEALARLKANVGDRAGEETAAPQRVYFDVNGVLRLAWRLQYRASSTALYDAVVDASTGRVLHRANLVRFVTQVHVFRHYPGAPVGGTQATVDLDPYLIGPDLFGPYAFAFADLNDDNAFLESDNTTPQDNELVFPVDANSLFQDIAGSGCAPTAKCSWNHATPTLGSPTGWGVNRRQNAMQAFWFVNHYRDHLASTPIGFTGFQCVVTSGPSACRNAADDPVVVNTDDGAAKDSGQPDLDHLNNANMSTPPDGSSPLMQMYLFYNGVAFGDSTPSPFRDVNGGDAAEIVYHEFTHGLSSRLVVDAGGVQALNSPQSGAMGEAWSDWYAMDFLNRPDPADGNAVYVPDNPATPGEVDLGDYTDAVPNTIRSQPLDCPVASTDPACPGLGTGNTGGYTYGDFGQICCGGPEVHADGEIWAETLWDLRTRLIADLGSVTAGSDAAEQLVTGGMRLSPPEPSFLDMRNAIVLAANAINPTYKTAIWDVFAHRGMGFFAGTINGSDTSPVEDFALPPAPGAPTGTVQGTITDRVTGRPIGGARIAIGGHTSGETTTPFTATTASDGTYSLPNIPAGTYGKVFVNGAGGYDAAEQRNVAVTAGTSPLNVALRRDWAATAGGAAIASDTDATGNAFGCGPAALLDQDQGIGWSAWTPTSTDIPAPSPTNHLVAGQRPSATIQLPRPVDITSFGADPGNTCGDGASATTKAFRIETSQDGSSFTTAVDGTSPANQFVPADAGEMKVLTPAAGASAVRFVRLTLLSPQATGPGFSGDDFTDFSELAVYGNAVPGGTLSVPATATTGQTVTLDASSFTDDSAIAGYAWDFDGDGTFDTATSTATTTTSYANAGTFTPRVKVTDDTGGSNTAGATIAVSAPAVPPGGGTPAKPKAPRLVLTGLKKANGVSLRIRCSSACAGRATLTAGKPLTSRLGLPRRVVSRIKIVTFAGTSTVRLAIKKSVLRRLRAERVRTVRLAVAAKVTDRVRQSASLTRSAKVRISGR